MVTMQISCLACPDREFSTVTMYMSVPCLHASRRFHSNYVHEFAQAAQVAGHQHTSYAAMQQFNC
jgi:hypothetical protein